MKLHITFLLCLAFIIPHIRSTMPADLNGQPVIESKDSKKTYYILGTCGIAILIGSLFLQRAGFFSKDRVLQRWDSLLKKISPSPERRDSANIDGTADERSDAHSGSDSGSDNDSDDENIIYTEHVVASNQAQEATNAGLRQEVNKQTARLPQEIANMRTAYNAEMAQLQQEAYRREIKYNDFLQRHNLYSLDQSNNLNNNNNNNNTEPSRATSAHQSNQAENIQVRPEIQALLDRQKELNRRFLASRGYTEEDASAPIGPSGLSTHAPNEPLPPLEELLSRNQRLIEASRAQRNPMPSGPVGPSSHPRPKVKSKSF